MSNAWITHVFSESPYSGTKLLIHLSLADNANEEGECWPSQGTIAKRARCTVRYVRSALQEMQDDGQLAVIENGVGRSNKPLYQMLGKEELCDTKSGTLEQEKGNSDAPYIREPSIEPSKNHDDEFEQFWKAYPRRVAKGNARKAFDKAIKRDSFENIMLGLSRYAFSSDEKFRPHPATWLNGDYWIVEELTASDIFADLAPVTNPFG